MRNRSRLPGTVMALAAGLVAGSHIAWGQQESPREDEGIRFRTGIELINVTATVTDAGGRFVPGLRKEDFRVYEDGERQTITHFDNERVPVSLGIVLDTSGSMEGERFAAARQALDRFLYELLDPADEVFMYRFDTRPELLEPWTTDRRRLSRAVAGIRPRGGTALYDAVAEAVPLAETGANRKKALVLLSDGVDTSSRARLRAVQQLIRRTEVLVYAIGIDAPGRRPTPRRRPGGVWPPRGPVSFPIPGRRGPSPSIGRVDRVDVAALRALTKDSGGRTEIVRKAQHIDPATAGIAHELSQQYYFAYASRGLRDGRWHAIEVEVDDPKHRVRARRGYVATP